MKQSGRHIVGLKTTTDDKMFAKDNQMQLNAAKRTFKMHSNLHHLFRYSQTSISPKGHPYIIT